jgi:hypothetical protein
MLLYDQVDNSIFELLFAPVDEIHISINMSVSMIGSMHLRPDNR